MRRFVLFFIIWTVAVVAAASAPAFAAVLGGSRANCLTVDLTSREAVSACTAAIKRSPQDKRLFVLRGIAWTNVGEYDFAISDFSRAASSDANNGMAIYLRGLAREKKGYLQQSLEDFNQCIASNVFRLEAQAALDRVQSALAANLLDKDTGAGKEAPSTRLSKIKEATHAGPMATDDARPIDEGQPSLDASAVHSSSVRLENTTSKEAPSAGSRLFIAGFLAFLNIAVIWLVARSLRMGIEAPGGLLAPARLLHRNLVSWDA